MSSHIERTVHPKNADRTRTHLNRVLVQFPEGVRNRTQAIAHRIETAGIRRKEGTKQETAIRVLHAGSNKDKKKMEVDGLITLQSGSNRRTKTIHLTAAGEALARETADRVAETEQQALAQFSEEEADQLFSLLRRLNALMIDIFPQTVRNQKEESQVK